MALVTGAASIGRPGATFVAASNVNVSVCPTTRVSVCWLPVGRWSLVLPLSAALARLWSPLPLISDPERHCSTMQLTAGCSRIVGSTCCVVESLELLFCWFFVYFAQNLVLFCDSILLDCISNASDLDLLPHG